MIDVSQLRAARALLGLDQRRLAELSGLSVTTIQRLEASDGPIYDRESLTRLARALAEAGATLIDDDEASTGGGKGVRLTFPAGRTQARAGGEDAPLVGPHTD